MSLLESVKVFLRGEVSVQLLCINAHVVPEVLTCYANVNINCCFLLLFFAA